MISDLDLAERSLRGDAEATTSLIDRALPTVRGFARRLAASPEDGDNLAQEAFLTALEKLRQYRGDASFATWVCSIALRHNRQMRRRRISELKKQAELGGQPLACPLPDEIAAAKDTEQRLWALVSRLPASQQKVLIARAHHENGAQAAAEIGLGPSAFRARLFRARKALRRLLLESYPDWSSEVENAK